MKIFNIPNPVVIGNTCNLVLDPSALFAINSIDKGALLPRLTDSEMNAIINPANGLIIYNTDIAQFCFYYGISWQQKIKPQVFILNSIKLKEIIMKFNVTIDEANIIIAALAELPFKISAVLIQKLQTRGKEQLESKGNTNE